MTRIDSLRDTAKLIQARYLQLLDPDLVRYIKANSGAALPTILTSLKDVNSANLQLHTVLALYEIAASLNELVALERSDIEREAHERST